MGGVASVTGELSAQRFERLRSLDQQSEREFLLSLRRLVVSQAASMVDRKTAPALRHGLRC
jgi:hypothetical protein